MADRSWSLLVVVTVQASILLAAGSYVVGHLQVEQERVEASKEALRKRNLTLKWEKLICAKVGADCHE